MFDAVTASLHGRHVVPCGRDHGRPAALRGGGRRQGPARAKVQRFDGATGCFSRAFHTLATAPQITIAAVSGYALGGGCELALAADFRFAGRSAKFGLPGDHTRHHAGLGGTQRLPRIVGLARAKELILSGRMVGADEALAIGLADRVLEDADLLDAAVEEALRYARGPLALRHAKRAVDAALDLPVEAGLELEAELIAKCFASEDGQRGLRGFVDKGPRKTSFLGR